MNKYSLVDIANAITEDDKCRTIENKNEIKKLNECYDLFESIFAADNLMVTKKIHEPLNKMGSVSVYGEVISLVPTKDMKKCLSRCSIFEIYAQSDSHVELELTYNNLANKPAN